MLEGSILQKLQETHQPSSGKGRSINFGVYYKNTLVALCHALEDALLTENYAPLVLTAFQRGKWYLQEAERYRDIAAQSRQIVIMAAPEAGFAEHPTSQLDNVDLVSLDSLDPVAQEWHLIVVSPNYTAMVLCQELSEADYGAAGLPTVDQERKFYGLWTFEPGLVQETAELAIAHIGAYNPALQQKLTAQLQDIQAQCQQQDALCGLPTADNLGEIVSRVVDYLRTSQQDLLQNAQIYDFLNQRGLDNNLLSNELQAFLRVAQLIDQTDLSNPMAAAEVATLAESMGQLLDLPAWQLHRLRLAGLLYRLAFMQNLKTELTPGIPMQQEEAPSVPLTCSLVPGTQMLRRMQRMKAIATILTHQTEWWDGSGQPAGLAGDEIPIESRILGLAAAFQQALATARSIHPTENSPSLGSAEALLQALVVCREQQGQRWDPKLIEVLELLISGLRQGLNLPISLPKIATGLWLLDPHFEEDLLRLEQPLESHN
jgi:DICT domain-containing protein